MELTYRTHINNFHLNMRRIVFLQSDVKLNDVNSHEKDPIERDQPRRIQINHS